MHSEMVHAKTRQIIRHDGIAARDSLCAEKRLLFSDGICKSLINLQEFKTAQIIMMYMATRSEVDLTYAIHTAELTEKTIAFPVCTDNKTMLAVKPENGMWNTGRFDIREPKITETNIISPQDIDLVVCPATTFDKMCNRVGMGAGYYDRFLPQCINAAKILVAFEVQRTEHIPTYEWDIATDFAITEAAIYRRN